jgi:hypothetical protein
LYKKSENIQELLESLRDAYIAYKESASRCKIELKPRPAPTTAEQIGGKKNEKKEFRNYYLPPGIP